MSKGERGEMSPSPLSPLVVSPGVPPLPSLQISGRLFLSPPGEALGTVGAFPMEERGHPWKRRVHLRRFCP